MFVPTSERLTFRRMTGDDLDNMVRLLGDPEVMTHYDHPKAQDECRAWIDWNERNYARDGYGLWIIETRDGEFVGDCGLTWQPIDGESLEVGYHVLPIHQGKGYGGEAARASVELARQRGEECVIAIIAQGNLSARTSGRTLLPLTGCEPQLDYGVKRRDRHVNRAQSRSAELSVRRTA